MCRFIAYMGHPILLDDVLIKPKNSLIKQSIHARETSEPLNGDGFGLGWYAHEIDPSPGLFKSIRPAWNNVNLSHLASKIKSSNFFAHIRAASEGNVTGNNCHPFNSANLLFMHNGGIGQFAQIKRHIRRRLNDEIYNRVHGETDSEHFFALFQQLCINHKIERLDANTMYEIFLETIRLLFEIQKENNAIATSFLNIAITDGHSMMVSRYVNDPSLEARTLYYAVGDKFCYEDGVCRMHEYDKASNKAVLIVSEKLNDFEAEWHPVPQNTCLLVHKNLDVELKPAI